MGIFLLLLAAYFLPTAIAIIRNHHNEGAIITLNVLAGWTFIGWLAALVWSLTSPPRQAGATPAKPTQPPAPAADLPDNQLQTALRHMENILESCREVSKPAFDVLIVAAQSDGKIGRDDIRIIANLFAKHGADIKPAWLESLSSLNAGVTMSVTGDQQCDEEIAALETASPAFKAGIYGAYIAMTVGNKRQTSVAKRIGDQLESLLAMPPATEAAPAPIRAENKERNQSQAPVKHEPAAPPIKTKPLTWVEQAQKEVEEERRLKTPR
jgi:hypothetical protein